MRLSLRKTSSLKTLFTSISLLIWKDKASLMNQIQLFSSANSWPTSSSLFQRILLCKAKDLQEKCQLILSPKSQNLIHRQINLWDNLPANKIMKKKWSWLTSMLSKNFVLVISGKSMHATMKKLIRFML
jgi:hypothetical protein